MSYYNPNCINQVSYKYSTAELKYYLEIAKIILSIPENNLNDFIRRLPYEGNLALDTKAEYVLSNRTYLPWGFNIIITSYYDGRMPQVDEANGAWIALLDPIRVRTWLATIDESSLFEALL